MSQTICISKWSRWSCAFVAGLLIHLLIWAGNRFIVGGFPAFETWLAPQGMQQVPVVVWLGALAVGGFILAVGITSARKVKALQNFADTAFLQRVFLVWATTEVVVSATMPLVLVLAGPWTPALVEVANLFTLYLFGIITTDIRYSKHQLAQHVVLLAGLAASTALFMLGVAQGVAVINSTVSAKQLAEAAALSVVAHLIFWFGMFFLWGSFPRLTAAAFANRRRSYGTFAGLSLFLAGLLWLTYGGGITLLGAQGVFSRFSNVGYLNSLLLFKFTIGVLLLFMFPLLKSLAGTIMPVVVAVTNVAAMALLVTFSYAGLALSASILLGIAGIAFFAAAFAYVIERHNRGYALAKPV